MIQSLINRPQAFHLFHPRNGSACGIDRDPVSARQYPDTLDMIGMLMCDQKSLNVLSLYLKL